MKKILGLIALSTLFFACETEDIFEKENFSGSSTTYFADGTSGTYFVTFEEAPATVRIVTTTLSSSDRVYNIEVDTEASTAVLGTDFTLPSATVTIPANEYFGEFTVQGDFDTATETGLDAVFNITGNTANDVMVGDSDRYTLSLFKQCVSELDKTYSVTTTYGYHDFLPDYSTATIETTIARVDGSEVDYTIEDFSGGLYSVGPYASAYGTAAVPLEFTDVCGNISWTGQTDYWGDIIPLDGGVNSVDLETGVITISWYCTGYGEEGVSVYTPID